MNQVSAPRFQLIAAGDDFLLAEALDAAVAAAAAGLGGVEAERLPEDASPESVALELRSPSLFEPRRLLVVADAAAWLDAPPPQGAGRRAAAVDVAPLAEALAEGLDDSLALVLGAWCGRSPKGPLVELADAGGGFRWIPVPPPPKPWDEAVVSDEQARVLEGVLARAAPAATFAPRARRLLIDRLGFAPRQLAQEARKLAAAAAGGEIDEALVRALVFPAERSLEKVQDAVLTRDPRPLADLLAAARAGQLVRDWQGRAIDADRVATMMVGQVASLLGRLLDLRLAAEPAGVAAELRPGLHAERWFQNRFKRDLAPRLEAVLDRDRPSPLRPAGGRAASTWVLGGLFQGAAEYSNDELAAALAELGEVEASLRGGLGPEALAAWSARHIPRPAGS